MRPESQTVSETDNIPRRTLSSPRLVLIFGGVVLLWILTPFILRCFYTDMPSQGQAGDLFGCINALFSGLAFAGVIVAILLQREELELQRHEITANRLELARSATAQEESREALRKTVYANTFKAARDILQEETVRKARGLVIQELQGKLVDQWNAQERDAAEIVCHTYDTVGIMVRHDMLPAAYIIDSWGHSLIETWKILKPLAEKYREERCTPDFYDDYEYLAEQANAKAQAPKRYQQ